MSDGRRKRIGRIGVAGALSCLVVCAAVSCGGDRAAPADRSADAAKAAPAAQANAAAAATSPTSRPVILFAGTSLTAGLGLDPDSAYPMLIQRKIDSAGLKYEVVNAGVSGETSSGLIDRLDWLLRGNFAVMLLETGANDGLRGIPTSTLKANLDSAVRRIRAGRPDARLVLIQMEALPNLGPKYATDFHTLYGEVAKREGVPLLPFLLQDVAGRKELNQADGVHPNNRGERIVADNVWKGLKPLLGAKE